MITLLLETPFHQFYHYPQSNCVVLIQRLPDRRVVLTSKETECFLQDFYNWESGMQTEYLAGMLWEAHAAPILTEIDMKGNK